MKLFSMLAAVLALSLSLTVGEAEAAKRLGGGSSIGMQRQATPPAAAPAAARPAPAAPQAQPKRSWMGPLAGLAAGLGLAALASHLGFGEGLASMMMIGLLVMAVVAVVGMVMRRRTAAQRPALAGAGMQYAGLDPNASARPFEPTPAPSPAQETAWTPDSAAAGTPTPGTIGSGHLPADFDVAGFERTAKVQFIRLQAANDAGNLDDLRAFTTPEMYAELKMNLSDRGAVAQHTEVVEIDARVLDVDEEAARYVVSVRFSGRIREDGAAAEAIDEIWHLVKPRYGNEGWRLAGIQQAR